MKVEIKTNIARLFAVLDISRHDCIRCSKTIFPKLLFDTETSDLLIEQNEHYLEVQDRQGHRFRTHFSMCEDCYKKVNEQQKSDNE